jgi:putative endonuclease
MSVTPARSSSPPDHRRRLGARGEAAAVEHLQRLGFAVLRQNVRSRHGEIDLICFDGSVLTFVEVKSRLRADRRRQGCDADAGEAIAPAEGVSLAQRRRLRRLAVAWLAERPPGVRPKEIRFDVIGVCFDRDGALHSLEHIQGAF